MKRVLAMLLVVATLLSACAQKPQSNPEPEAPTTQPTEVTQPNVQPEDEPQEENALQAYSLEGSGYYALAAMGGGILLFSGEERTVLTYIGKDTEPVSANTGDVFLFPSATGCTISDRGIGYYDRTVNQTVFLNTALEEIRRVDMPEDMACDPLLSEDWQYAYYFDDDYLRCMDMDTGICRLLSDTWGGVPQVTGIHFGGRLLQCSVFQNDISMDLLIDTQTGQLVYQDEEMWILDTAQDWYFAQVYQSWGTEYVFGGLDEANHCLAPATAPSFVQVLPEEKIALLCEDTEAGFRLDLYDTQEGIKKSSLIMEGLIPCDIAQTVLEDKIWILAEDKQAGTQTLYSWDPARSLTEDSTSYIAPYYTADTPDTEGLDRIAKEAQQLGDRYSVRVLVYQRATDYMPVDFTFEEAYAVGAYEYYLPILEKALSAYPDGFLKKLGKSSGNGRLTVSLVKTAWGDSELGAVSRADGVQFWDDGNAYLTLAMNDRLESTVHHELFHVIDTFVLTETLAYDFWNQLNPEGFQYSNDYSGGTLTEDSPYLQDETRAFIDAYSMTYAKEDRARIMEYAMQPGNAQLFSSPVMQEKLRTVCVGIREAFGLTREPTVFPWEQYLEAIAYDAG